MELILLKDLKNYGKKGSVINVNDGYANNYLIPNGYANPANIQNKIQAKQAKESEEHKQLLLLNEAKEIKTKLNNIVVTLKVKCGDNGKIFGSITSKEIAEDLFKQGYDIDKKKIELENVIKSVGRYLVKIKLHPQVSASIALSVVTE
jgi:large subunit ribosomal protein L9